jgi:hypothetical protein
MSVRHVTSISALPWLVLAGCSLPAAERREREMLLSGWAPPAGQRCAIDTMPAQLPSLAFLGDSALLATLVSQFWERSEREGGRALLSIKFDANGRLVRSRVIETEMPDSLARRLEVMVASALDDERPAVAIGLRLEIMVDSLPRFRLGRRQLCAPSRVERPPAAGLHITETGWAERDIELGPSPAWVLQGTGQPGSSQSGTVAMHIGGRGGERDSIGGLTMGLESAAGLPEAPGSETLLGLLIGKDGRVRGIERLAGFADTALIERAVRWAFRQRYHPALDDRIPTEGVVTIRIR